MTTKDCFSVLPSVPAAAIRTTAQGNEKHVRSLLFTLRPIQEVVDEYYDRQLEELELTTERQRVAKLLREQESPA